MGRIGVRAVAALGIGIFLAIAGATSASAAPTDDVIDAVNQERAWRGITPLVQDATLDRVAQEWAQTMSSTANFQHSTHQWRADRIPKGWTSHGENIAYGFRTPGEVMYGRSGSAGWMGSDGHRANILRPGYTHIGMGFVASGNYWVQIFAGYPASAAPSQPVKGPWPLARPAYSSTIYELVSANGVVTPTPIDYNRWQTVYGGTRPTNASTDYVKYPWSPTVYAVTYWPGGESKWMWEALTSVQWNTAGQPRPRNAGWIAGSRIHKWGTGPELFLTGADEVVHKLTGKEWADTGNKGFETRADQGYLRLTWSPEIVFSADTKSADPGKPVTSASWNAAANPSPLQRQRFTGDEFYMYAGSGDIFYAGPTMERAITYPEWVGAGKPSPELRTR